MGETEYIVGYKIKNGKPYYTCRTTTNYDKAIEWLAEWECMGWKTIIRGRNNGVIYAL